MDRKMNQSVEKAYNYLLNAIISFELPPEQPLSYCQIAKQLELSRSPVRDAIMLLQGDGLAAVQNGKTIVAPMTMDDVIDILNVRIALECECIRIIAENGWLSAEQEEKMKSLHNGIVEFQSADNLSAHYDADDRFHCALIGYAGSARIIRITDQLRLQMQRVRWLNRAVPERMTATIAEHETLLDAIVRHNEHDAIAAMRTHLKNSEESFRNVLNDESAKCFARAMNSFLSPNSN